MGCEAHVSSLLTLVNQSMVPCEIPQGYVDSARNRSLRNLNFCHNNRLSGISPYSASWISCTS